MATNRAIAVSAGHKNSSRIVDIELPSIDESEVLVRVLEVGICGTDAELDEGLYGETPSDEMFLVIGHESLGIVEEVGASVNNLKKGDYVVATVRRPCPKCVNCENEQNDMCLTGEYLERGIKGLHGYMVNYYKERPEFLIKVPQRHRNIGVLLEPLSIIEKAVTQTLEMQKRMFWDPKKVLVLGAGPIGLLATMLFRNLGLEVYTLATRSSDSLKATLVCETGATYINVKKDPIITLKSKVGSFDLIVDATGSAEAAFDSICLLETNGVLCLTSVTCGAKKIEIDVDKLNLDLVLGNKIVYGIVNSNPAHFKSGVQHFDEFEKKWPGLMSRLITRRESFENFKKALTKEREDIKTVLEISSEKAYNADS